MSAGSSDPVHTCPPNQGRPAAFGAKPSSRGGLASVARLVKLGRCKNIVVVAGAGISTASGIPDFRLVSVCLSSPAFSSSQILKVESVCTF